MSDAIQTLSWDIHHALSELTAWNQQHRQNPESSHGLSGSIMVEQDAGHFGFRLSQTMNQSSQRNRALDSDLSLYAIRRTLRRLDRLMIRVEQEIHECVTTPSTSKESVEILGANFADYIPIETVISGPGIMAESTHNAAANNKNSHVLDHSQSIISSDKSCPSSSENEKMYNCHVSKRQRVMTSRLLASTIAQLREDTLRILTVIPILLQDDTAFHSACSIMQSISRMLPILSCFPQDLDEFNPFNNESLPSNCEMEKNSVTFDVDNEMIRLIHERILQYAIKSKSNMVVYKQDISTDTRNNTNTRFSIAFPLLIWLEVVNNFYDKLDMHATPKMNMSTMGVTSDLVGTSVSDSAMIRDDLCMKGVGQLLPLFVQMAIEYCRMNEWDSSQLQNPYIEANVQFRIATVHIINQLIIRYQTEQKSNYNLCYWLHFVFDGKEDSISNDSKEQSSFNVNISTNFLSNVAVFASELVDYATDAMDGVALTLRHPLSSTSISTAKQEPTIGLQNTVMNHAELNREETEQDCLRHISLVVGYLSSIHVWFVTDDTNRSMLVDSQRRLWKSLSNAMLEISTPFETANFGWNLCQSLMMLTNLIIDTHSDWNEDTTATLSLVFLRTLEHPDLLLSETANSLWITLKSLMRSNSNQTDGANDDSNDLRNIVQVAYLTLRDSVMSLPQASNHMFHPNSKQDNIRIVLEKIKSLLADEVPADNKTEKRKINLSFEDPWDKYFLAQIQND